MTDRVVCIEKLETLLSKTIDLTGSRSVLHPAQPSRLVFNPASRILAMAVWLFTATDTEVLEPLSQRLAGVIAAKDIEKGYWWSPSNTEIKGIVGMELPVTAPANFINVQRTADIIHESLEYAMLQFLDRRSCRPWRRCSAPPSIFLPRRPPLLSPARTVRPPVPPVSPCWPCCSGGPAPVPTSPVALAWHRSRSSSCSIPCWPPVCCTAVSATGRPSIRPVPPVANGFGPVHRGCGCTFAGKRRRIVFSPRGHRRFARNFVRAGC